MSPFQAGAAAGRTIILLGRRGAGKTRLLLGVARRERAALQVLSLRLPPEARIGYCSQQGLLHGQLTAQENLRLVAAAAGVRAWREQLARLMPDLPWDAGGDGGQRTRAAMLPREEARLLALATALLPDPALLLIDDLAHGLSRPAQQALWRRLRAMQRHVPRLILYATRDLQAAQHLQAETWLWEGGLVAARWQAGAEPQSLRALEAYGLTMKRPEGAARLLQAVRALQPLHWALRVDGVTVDVVAQGGRLPMLEVAAAAGDALAHFAPLQAEVDLLPGSWFAAVAEAEPAAEPITVAPGAQRQGAGGERAQNGGTAVGLIALAEWRRFFSDPGRIAWPVACNVLLLSALVIAVARAPQRAPDSWLLLQGVAAAPGLLLGWRAGNYWRRTTEVETVFRAIQARDGNPGLTRRALYELAGGRRSALWAGLALGGTLIVLAHNILFQLSWLLLLWERERQQDTGAPTAAIGLLLAATFVALGLAAGNRRGKGG